MTTALHRAITDQPEHLAKTLSLDLAAPLESLTGAQRIWLVGTGSSQHAAELGALMFRRAGRSADWSSSAAFAHDGPELHDGDAVIVISHTTQTSFARASRARVQSSPAALVTITGRGGDWPEAIRTVPPEESETYTTSYTSVLAVLARLSGYPASILAQLPERARQAVAAGDEVPVPPRCLVVAGVGPAAITAREGALKLREAARVLSEGYEAEYLLHGGAVPLTAEDRLLLLSPEADPDRLLELLGQAAQAEGVPVSRFHGNADGDPLLAQIPLTIRLQALAERAARARGQNPDVVITGGWAGQALWAAGAPGASA